VPIDWDWGILVKTLVKLGTKKLDAHAGRDHVHVSYTDFFSFIFHRSLPTSSIYNIMFHVCKYNYATSIMSNTTVLENDHGTDSDTASESDIASDMKSDHTESDSDTESEMSENGNLIDQGGYNGDAIEGESSDTDARAEKFVSMMQRGIRNS
jgi:hypothetical protein